MKRFLLLLATFVAWTSNAQIVNIPDANFKSYLLNITSDSREAKNSSGNYIAIDANADGEIQVIEAESIYELEISPTSSNRFSSIEGIEAFTSVNTLRIIHSGALYGNFSSLVNLNYLYISDGFIAGINVNGLINLDRVNIEFSPISNLDFSGATHLRTLSLMNLPELERLVLGSNSVFEYLYVYCDKINYIDLSGCPNLSSGSCSLGMRYQDIYVNIKNGNPVNSDGFSIGMRNFLAATSTTRCYVCIDEGEDILLSSPYIILSTYCDFTPGGNYNTIAGTLTFDGNNNGCDASDVLLPYAAVEINDGATTGYSYTADGSYSFYTQEGTFTLTPHFENNWFTASPATVTFADNNNNTATQDFCVTPNGVHNDVEAAIEPIGIAQPGFDAAYRIIYKNKGNQTLNGAVSLTYNDDVLDYVTSSVAPSSNSLGTLSWNYANLLPFESREITFALNVNSPMEVPAVNIGYILPYSVSITPVTADETPADNTFAFNQIVAGSYDPNDITCLEGSSVHPEKIGEYLHYNINFKNTGTAPATFVVVKDIIDLAKFDISTLQILNASHAMQARITGNKVEFIFDEINLAANGGKGNVTFKIKTLNTLAVNSSVTQAADIFFDYNWPIVTNDAVTTFEVLNTFIPVKDTSVKVYPNPVMDVVKVSADSVITSLQLFDLQGRVLQSQQSDANATQLDLSGRAAGVYFIKVSTEKGASVQKVIKE
jgi:hypothetical protein